MRAEPGRDRLCLSHKRNDFLFYFLSDSALCCISEPTILHFFYYFFFSPLQLRQLVSPSNSITCQAKLRQVPKSGHRKELPFLRTSTQTTKPSQPITRPRLPIPLQIYPTSETTLLSFHETLSLFVSSVFCFSALNNQNKSADE